MTIKCLIKPSEYHDSVSLMLMAKELASEPGVADAAVVMGTEANKAILKEAGLLTAEAQAAGANDLVVALNISDQAAEHAIFMIEKIMQKKLSGSEESSGFRSKTLRGAYKANNNANIAVISVAGRYATNEAWDALRQGLHVLLFSDNVSLEDEIALKQYASEHGLLLMGPGAGTAILNGVALGFANIIPPGPVGIVSAAGTGLQEVSTLLAKHGVGITQGLGTGGRDLKKEVGGLMMSACLQALQDDPATEIITIVSKPPSPAVAQKILELAAKSPKTTIICFLGQEAQPVQLSGKLPGGLPDNILLVQSLEEAAWLSACAGGAKLPDWRTKLGEEEANSRQSVLAYRTKLSPQQKYLRGLFSGGTLCYEAQTIWQSMLGEPVYSNAPLLPKNQLVNSIHSVNHTAVDLGEEEFTVGRPHPMIDNDLRIRRMLQEARDPETALIFLDIVLGYSAHPDPASELALAVQQAQQIARQNNNEIIFIASITGSIDDPQNLKRQENILAEAGVQICESNAAAARLAAWILQAHAGQLSETGRAEK